MQHLHPIKRPRGRPPKKTDGQLDTKDQLIRQGTTILTEKGFSSTGIVEILREINIPKGSFYHYFASKDEFGLAVVENFGTYFARKLDKWLLNTDRAPLDRMVDFIEDAKDGMRRYDFRRGCLIGNLGQELGSLNEDFRDPLETIFLDWQARVARCLDDAKASGHIPTALNTDEMAAFFWIGWEGAILRSKLVKSTDPLDLFASVFFSSLSHKPPVIERNK